MFEQYEPWTDPQLSKSDKPEFVAQQFFEILASVNKFLRAIFPIHYENIFRSNMAIIQHEEHLLFNLQKDNHGAVRK
jgi:hypothetical protein